MVSTVAFIVSVGVTTVDCYRLRIVVDMFNIECSWVHLLSLTSWLLLRLGIVRD